MISLKISSKKNLKFHPKQSIMSPSSKINLKWAIPSHLSWLSLSCYSLDVIYQQQLKIIKNKMKLKTIGSFLFRRSIRTFSDEQQSGGKFVNFVKSAWRQTFPEQEDVVKQRYQKVKEEKRFSKEELDKIQADTSQYLRGALVSSETAPTETKEGFKLSNLVPEAVKEKIRSTSQYKEYEAFKENFKEYASTREGVIANAGSTVYSTVAQGSPEARATELMRQYIKDFSIYNLEEESTVIFKNAYHAFLNEKLSEVETMAMEQAYEYFSAHVKMNRSKKWKPKFNEIIFNYPAQFQSAKVGDKLIPTFEFNIKIIEIYCFVDNDGKIIEGSEDRVIESVFEFGIIYNGEHIDTLGHPWALCEIKKLQEMKMLV